MFFISSFVAISLDNRVIVDREEYQLMKSDLSTYKKRFDKVLYLEDLIRRDYYQSVDEINFDDAIYKGIFEGLEDPYSEYMNPEDYKEFAESINGNYAGIGVYVDIKDASGYVRIIEVIDNTPAQEAGLKAGDQIYKVNEKIYTTEEGQEAIDMIKGKPGTTVDIVFLRDGEELPLTIERKEVHTPAVKSEMKANNIGYIKIISFQDQVSDEFNKHLDELLAKGMKGLVIDLRNNPGGDLNEVNHIADRILGDQIIETIKTRDGKEESYRSDEATKIDIPFVVLANRYSASASEILSGAIKDTKSGVIIGETTYGKGVVQTINSLGDGSYYKLTTSYYLTPNGTNIHKEGISPNIDMDQVRKEGYDVDNREKDELLRYAEDYLKK